VSEQKLPEFVVAGVARSGTTSAFHYLSQHPDLFVPRVKEPKYLSRSAYISSAGGPGDSYVFGSVIKSEAKYRALYAHNTKLAGDFSSDYFYHCTHSIPEIKRVLGDPKIIIFLRNPVDRAFSAYMNLVRDQRESLSFRAALAAEGQREAEAWDWMWLFTSGSMYAERVELFKKEFSSVNVVIYEEFIERPDEVLDGLCKFLNIPSFTFDTSQIHSYSGEIKSPFFAGLISRKSTFGFYFRQGLQMVFSRSQLERLSRLALRKRSANEDERLAFELRNFFANDVVRLEAILGRELSAWR
jgi:hypothetical protein